jgi:hypothetical protein
VNLHQSLKLRWMPLPKTISIVQFIMKLVRFAGTEITELVDDGKMVGLVLTSGSFTTKGEFLSEVLSYERHRFKFDDDVKLVLFILMFEGIIFVSVVFKFLDNDWVYSWFYGRFPWNLLVTLVPN